MRNSTLEAVSTIPCATRASCIRTGFSCVLTSRMPLQENLASLIASLIAGRVVTRATTHESPFAQFLLFFLSLSIDMVTTWSIPISSTIATGLESLRVIRPAWNLIPSIYFPVNAFPKKASGANMRTTKSLNFFQSFLICSFVVTTLVISRGESPADCKRPVFTCVADVECICKTMLWLIGFGPAPVSKVASVNVRLSSLPIDTITL